MVWTVSLKYTVAIYTNMPPKILGMTLILLLFRTLLSKFFKPPSFLQIWEMEGGSHYESGKQARIACFVEPV